MQDGLLPGTEGHKELAESKPEELEFQTTSLMVSYRKAAHISLYCITLENLYGHSVYNCCRAQQIQTRTEYRQRCMKDACCIKSHRLELRENIRWSSSFRSLSCDSSIDFFSNRVLHRVRSIASSLNFKYPRVFLRSSSSCLRLHLYLNSRFYPSFCPSVKKKNVV